MVLIAALLYLPEHIATMASRAWFYYTGDEAAAAAAAAAALAGSVTAGGGGNVEGILKGPLRTAGAGAEAGAVLRRVDLDINVDSVVAGKVDVDRRRGEGDSVKVVEARRMPGDEVLELLGRL